MSGKAVLLAVALSALSLSATRAAAAPVCDLQQMAELPVRMIGLRPTVTVKVNGVDSDLLLDTGVFQTVVSRPSAERFGLSVTPAPIRFRFRGVGGEERDIGSARAKDFNFAGAQIHNVPLMVAGHAGGRGLDGNLGLNLLTFADLEIDLAHKVVRFFHPEGCVGGGGGAYWADPKTVSWVEIAPVDLQTQHILGDASVNGVKVRVSFDTGASRSGLSRRAAERLGFKVDGPGVRPGGRVRGFGPAAVESWIMPVSVFSMGGEQIRNTQLRVIDSEAKDHDLVIGADFFLAHRVYVSPKARRVSFTYNGSGPVFLLDRPPAAETEPPAAPATPQ